MRVTGGMWRGVTLMTPEDNSIRPTADKTRLAIFNTILSGRFGINLMGATILDGTAGTGAMGIEALSRGAAFCHFADPSAQAQKLIAANVTKTKCAGDRYRIHKMMAQQLPPANMPCDIIFLDPPYGSGALPDMIANLCTNGWANTHTLFVIEEDRKASISLPLKILDKRDYGAAQILYCQMPA